MFSKKSRMALEEITLRAMVDMYCRVHHKADSVPCPECAGLLEYALHRLSKCPYQDKKPVCAKCPIHCYKPEMRGRIAPIMRYSGPRLMRHHPILALLHLWDRRRKATPLSRSR